MKRCIGVLLVIVFMPLIVGAVEVSELENRINQRQAEIEALEAEIQEYQKSLDSQQGVSENLKGEIQRIETEIKRINSDIRLTQSRIDKKELEIENLSLGIYEREEAIEKSENSLAELVRTRNEQDAVSIIEVLFSSETLSDFFGDLESVYKLNENLQEHVTLLEDEKLSLSQEREERREEERSLSRFQQDLSGKKSVQDSINKSKQNLLRDSKNQESEYQKILREREEQRSLIQQEIRSIEEELRVLIDPSLLPTKGTGVLLWPVEDPLVTQEFGFTEFATTHGSDVYKGNGHNGIDFRAPIGTRIISAANGKVIDTGNTDTICYGGSYGKWVLIEHTNNLTTLYAHLSSIIVNPGDTVDRGTIIGYAGNTGYTTGPHLHFTVYASHTSKVVQTRNCGLIPAGGYLNPLDYL